MSKSRACSNVESACRLLMLIRLDCGLWVGVKFWIPSIGCAPWDDSESVTHRLHRAVRAWQPPAWRGGSCVDPSVQRAARAGGVCTGMSHKGPLCPTKKTTSPGSQVAAVFGAMAGETCKMSGCSVCGAPCVWGHLVSIFLKMHAAAFETVTSAAQRHQSPGRTADG